MTIDLTDQIATGPEAVARFTAVSGAIAGGIYPEDLSGWRPESDAANVVNQLQSVTFLASLSVALDFSSQTYPTARFAPLEAAGAVVGFSSAAASWMAQELNVAETILAVATSAVDPAEDEERPPASAMIDRLRKQTERTLKYRDAAKYATFAKAAAVASQTSPYQPGWGRKPWARRLVAGPLSEAEEAATMVAEVERSFPLFVAEAEAGAEAERPAGIWGRVAGRATLASARCRTVYSVLSKTQWLAADAALEPFLPSEAQVLRISYASPLEMVVAVVGSLGAAVALFDQLLDIEVKLRTRSSRIEAEEAKFREEIRRSGRAQDALEDIRTGLPEAVRITAEVFESLSDEEEDRSPDPRS
jgi:hypothetical protein